MAWFWLPETVHRTQAGSGLPFRHLATMMKRPGLRRVLVIDFVYWFAFAVFQTTFGLFAARRFNFDAPQTGYFFAAFGLFGAIVQGTLIRPIVKRFGDKPAFMLGLVFTATGLVATALTHSVAVFTLTLVPLALGIGIGHPTMSSLVSREGRSDEQGRVQGAASAVESLGRTHRTCLGQRVLATLWRRHAVRLGRRVPDRDAHSQRRLRSLRHPLCR